MNEQSNKGAYEWNASDYARHSVPQQEWARELIDKLRLKGNEHLLDIGCGDGKVTAEIAKHLNKGRVVGIDNSQNMIALATQEFPVSQYPNLFFRQADASDSSLTVAKKIFRNFNVIKTRL